MPVQNRASFCPPPLPEPARANAAWVLLDKKAYIARRRENATTSRAKSRGGDTVEVSFCLSDAPALSYACLHCADLLEARHVLNGGFSTEPVIACSEGAFVLLEVRFNQDILLRLGNPRLLRLQRRRSPRAVAPLPPAVHHRA